VVKLVVPGSEDFAQPASGVELQPVDADTPIGLAARQDRPSRTNLENHPPTPALADRCGAARKTS
jgi:hypothetical protein